MMTGHSASFILFEPISRMPSARYILFNLLLLVALYLGHLITENLLEVENRQISITERVYDSLMRSLPISLPTSKRSK